MVFVFVRITPTIPMCSVATLIGLSVLAKLRRSLPLGYSIKVGIKPGTHNDDATLNRQLADKERVIAALQNENLIRAISMAVKDSDLLPPHWASQLWYDQPDEYMPIIDISELTKTVDEAMK